MIEALLVVMLSLGLVTVVVLVSAVVAELAAYVGQRGRAARYARSVRWISALRGLGIMAPDELRAAHGYVLSSPDIVRATREGTRCK